MFGSLPWEAIGGGPLQLGSGFAGTFFWGPSSKPQKEWPCGWRVGPVLLGTNGPIYAFSASRYWAGPHPQNKRILDFLNSNVVPPESDRIDAAMNFTSYLIEQIRNLIM